MAIRAIVSCLLGQQTMFLHKESAVIGYYAGAAMTVLAFPKLDVFIVSVVGPGKGETDYYEKKGHRQEDDFQSLIIYHGLPSKVQYLMLMATKP
jgi:hypothetical protein